MSILKHTNKYEKIYSRARLRIPKIQLSKNSNNKQLNGRSRKILKIVIILIIGIFIAKNVTDAINPIINMQCINQAKNMATLISNEQATVIMKKYKYEDLATVIKDENGKIQMIKLNIIPVNEITSDIAVKIQNELNNIDNTQISIRMGSFSGIKLLSGVGPKFNIRVSSNGNIETNLKSEFKTAGINQTLHQIYLEIKCNITILTPYDSASEEIVNQILIAESIIVGEIPNSYYNLDNGNSRETIKYSD